jgi:hypothetical protein
MASAQTNKKKADVIVNDMIVAMGGQKNYNATHFIQWDFLNRRLFWDKFTGDVRIEDAKAKLVVLVNLNTLKGKMYQNGILVKDQKKANEFLVKARDWWINDSYWLVMPWKLQDSGVNLTYVKEGQVADGKKADILQLTFNAVGVTPNNKYWLYVDKQDHLIKQWAHYKNFNDKTPQFIKPWNNYHKAGAILLSYNRPNEAVGPTNVIVKSNMNTAIFKSL